MSAPRSVAAVRAPGAVTLAELRQRLREPGLKVIDVLPRPSFDEGHIPGSLSLPLDELESRAAVVLPDKAQEIVVYCGSDT